MRDHNTVRAKKEGLRARSAYKLVEINKKYHILEDAKQILDLGCWPGGWSLIAARYAPVTAVDLKPMAPTPRVDFIQADLHDDSLIELLPMADVVLSDAMANTSGNSRDQYLSFLLCMRALEIAHKRLWPGGSFVCKIFQGEDFDYFLASVRKHFSFVKSTKPPTSRSESKEMYIVATGFTPGTPFTKEYLADDY